MLPKDPTDGHWRKMTQKDSPITAHVSFGKGLIKRGEACIVREDERYDLHMTGICTSHKLPILQSYDCHMPTPHRTLVDTMEEKYARHMTVV